MTLYQLQEYISHVLVLGKSRRKRCRASSELVRADALTRPDVTRAVALFAVLAIAGRAAGPVFTGNSD